MKKCYKNSFFTFVLGIISTIFIGYAGASILINANNIGYTTGDGTWYSLEGAVNELYENYPFRGEFNTYSVSIPKGTGYTGSVNLTTDKIPNEIYVFCTYGIINIYNPQTFMKMGMEKDEYLYNGSVRKFGSGYSGAIATYNNGVLVITGHESGAISCTIKAR